MTLEQFTALLGLLLALLLVSAALIVRRVVATRTEAIAITMQADEIVRLDSGVPLAVTPNRSRRRLVADPELAYDPLLVRQPPSESGISFDDVERRMEEAFNQFDLGLIDLDTYQALVAAVETRVIAEANRLSKNLNESGQALHEEVDRSLALVRHCLAWIESHRHETIGSRAG